MRADVAKLIIAVILDALDFTVGRIPGFELPFDIVMGIAAVSMFGWPGLFAFWETADLSGQIDGFVPTLTIIALTQMGKNKKKEVDHEPPPVEADDN